MEPYKSNQEVFDKVIKHMYDQGKQSIANGRCAYRGVNGTSCAIGCLIPDESYTPAAEGFSVFSALRLTKTSDNFEQIDGKMLNELQMIHDSIWSSGSDQTSETRTESKFRELLILSVRNYLGTKGTRASQGMHTLYIRSHPLELNEPEFMKDLLLCARKIKRLPKEKRIVCINIVGS